MTWTVRIYSDDQMSSHTDQEVTDEAAAYAVIYNEPLPLPAVATLKTPGTTCFDIYNDVNVCVFSMPTGANHGKNLS
jgi:hypothetical protein